MSWIKTFSLIIVLTVLVILAGGAFGGMQGLIIAAVFAGLMNFFGFWFSDKLALAMAGAKPVTEKEEPRLHAMIADVARMAGMPKPRVYLINNDSPNAFATGRSPSHSVVAVTTGIRSLLTEEELRGVIAHEMAHIKNRDMLVMTTVAVLAGIIAFLATMAQWSLLLGGGRRDNREGGNAIGIVALIATIILLPLMATLIRFAISRTREYAADETGAKIIRNPHALASGLEKLGSYVSRKPMQASAANEAMAHMYIVNPLGAAEMHAKETGGGMVSLFSTHPPIPERVRRLRAMVLS
jgi:heat shock protein HtpX